MKRFPVVATAIVLVATAFISGCSTSDGASTPLPNERRNAENMLRDETIFHVQYLAQQLSSNSSISNFLLTTDEQGLKKNVKLANIIARYGTPDKTKKNEKDETSAAYFDKIQFIANKDGIVSYAFIKTN